MRAGGQQVILGESARREDADDLATQRTFAATRFLLFRILGLLADGDTMAGTDQPRQIAIHRMHRHTAHRNVVAIALAAFCQGDAKRGGADFGILEEHLVKVAHTVEQQGIRVRLFDLHILRDHRGWRLYFCSAWW